MATTFDEAVAAEAATEPAPRNALEWMARLEKQLNADQRALRTYDDYYDGRHPLSFATPKFRDAFGINFREFADNWCCLVVDAVEERLNVEGFRLGNNAEGDKRAWKIWQANQLDAESQLAHTEALVNGRSYVLVWYGDDPKVPEITVEHPSQMTVATAAGNRRQRVAAMKRWLDDSGFIFATLYLPDGLYKFRSIEKVKTNRIATTGSLTRWTQREVAGEPWPLPNPLGVVPVVPLNNRPRLLSAGMSEIAQVIPTQNAINKLVMDMIVASEFGAAPQRWATGLEIPRDPATNQPIEIFKTLTDRLWTSKSKDTTFGAFSAADLSNFVKAIELLVQHVASQTRTPPHYFYLSGQMPSGESIKSAETGLVAKTRRKMRFFGEAWEEVIRLGLMVVGDRKANVTSGETIWADPESRSEAQHIDAVIKTKLLNVPDEILWEKAGFSPQEIERMNAIVAAAPPVPPPVEAIHG